MIEETLEEELKQFKKAMIASDRKMVVGLSIAFYVVLFVLSMIFPKDLSSKLGAAFGCAVVVALLALLIYVVSVNDYELPTPKSKIWTWYLNYRNSHGPITRPLSVLPEYIFYFLHWDLLRRYS